MVQARGTSESFTSHSSGRSTNPQQSPLSGAGGSGAGSFGRSNPPQQYPPTGRSGGSGAGSSDRNQPAGRILVLPRGAPVEEAQSVSTQGTSTHG